MFDLKVQSTYQPGNYPAASGKICRCFDLVYGPLIRHFISGQDRGWKFSVLNSMRELKNYAEYETGEQPTDKEADKPGCPAQQKNRQYDK